MLYVDTLLQVSLNGKPYIRPRFPATTLTEVRPILEKLFNKYNGDGYTVKKASCPISPVPNAYQVRIRPHTDWVFGLDTLFEEEPVYEHYKLNPETESEDWTFVFDTKDFFKVLYTLDERIQRVLDYKDLGRILIL